MRSYHSAFSKNIVSRQLYNIISMQLKGEELHGRQPAVLLQWILYDLSSGGNICSTQQSLQRFVVFFENLEEVLALNTRGSETRAEGI